MSMIKVVQKKSTITESVQTCKIMQALGLKGIRSVKIHKDNNCIRGMVNKVIHLVEYELLKTDSASSVQNSPVAASTTKAKATKPKATTKVVKSAVKAKTTKPKEAKPKVAKAKVAKAPAAKAKK